MSRKTLGHVGAVVGYGAAVGGPGDRGGVDEQQAADFVGEHRGEGDGFGAAVGVADDDVRSGSPMDPSPACRSAACDLNVCVAEGGSLVPVPKRAGVHTRACSAIRRLDRSPVLTALGEPGDQHHGRRPGADATDVHAGAAHDGEPVDRLRWASDARWGGVRRLDGGSGGRGGRRGRHGRRRRRGRRCGGRGCRRCLDHRRRGLGRGRGACAAGGECAQQRHRPERPAT